MRSGGSRWRMSAWLTGAAWVVVTVVGGVAATQVLRWSGLTPILAVLQSLTPYLGLLLVPIVVLALWCRRFLLATAALAVGAVVLVLATPLAVPGEQAEARPGSTGLRVASANLWYRNDRIDDVAEVLSEIDADVVVLNEYTREHQEALHETALSSRYPYHVDHSGRGASGIAVWSRFPITAGDSPSSYVESIDVSVDGPDGDLRVVAMHVPTPVSNFDAWRADLALAEQIGRDTEGPLLLVGDLNASYWHPDFRRLLDAGFTDAHIAAGRGYSTSWPTTWVVPPFVRLDHALTAGGLVSSGVDDFEIPGSDHRGLVVSVAPAR